MAISRKLKRSKKPRNTRKVKVSLKQFLGWVFMVLKNLYRKHIPTQILRRDIVTALKHKQFIVYYQPILSLENGRIIGMEALLRWRHPQYGVLTPTEFIPLAVETGQMLDIQNWVLKEACKQLSIWNKRIVHFNSLKISVNISLVQLRQKHLLHEIDKILLKTEVAPEYLQLDLTENAVLEEQDLFVINRLSKKGIQLSLKDFATSHLKWRLYKYLKQNVIKIDSSSVQNITTNSSTIVAATIAMAKQLGMKTLAEGVETAEQFQFLKLKKCDLIQGYYYSHPVNSKEFEELFLSTQVG